MLYIVFGENIVYFFRILQHKDEAVSRIFVALRLAGKLLHSTAAAAAVSSQKYFKNKVAKQTSHPVLFENPLKPTIVLIQPSIVF